MTYKTALRLAIVPRGHSYNERVCTWRQWLKRRAREPENLKSHLFRQFSDEQHPAFCDVGAVYNCIHSLTTLAWQSVRW